MFKKIEITVELTPDREVGGYVAYCPELDITTEGETVEEAISMMKEAAEGYIEIVGVNNKQGKVKVFTFDNTDLQ